MSYLNILKRKISYLIFAFLPIVSYGFEDSLSKEEIADMSDEAVVVMKISGRMNCNIPRIKKIIDKDSACYKSYLSNDLLDFNKKTSFEEFFVLRSFRGNKKYGDIIKVRYSDPIGGDAYLNLGGMYLVFFRKEKYFYRYEFYGTVEYKKLEPLITEKTSFTGLIEVLKNNPSIFWVPMDFYIEE